MALTRIVSANISAAPPGDILCFMNSSSISSSDCIEKWSRSTLLECFTLSATSFPALK